MSGRPLLERRRGPERILLSGLVLLLLGAVALFTTRPDLVRRVLRAVASPVPDLPADPVPPAPPRLVEPSPAVEPTAHSLADAPPPTWEAPDPVALADGTRLFREAAEWVGRGLARGSPVHRAYLNLEARFRLDGSNVEGTLRLWLQAPDLFRQEMTISNAVQTKILDGESLWIAGQDGRFKNVARTGEGARTLAQAKEDRERLADLATIVTLRGLEGPRVTFEFMGETNPSGDYQRQDVPGQPSGTWLKLVRKAAGRPNITFWLAHATDAQGVKRATYPGVVRVDGEPQNGIPTEDYILQDWNDRPNDPPRPFRFPRRLRAFQFRPGQPPLAFLDAVLPELEIDQGIDPSRFQPPR